MEIISKKDARNKGAMHYYTGNPCNHGHYSKRLVSTGKCSECHANYHNNYMKKWQKDNKETVSTATRKWRRENKESAKAVHKKYYEANKEKKLAANKQWREDNRDKQIQYNANRRANKLKATPVWADVDAMVKIYKKSILITEETGVPHDVDHFYPLQSDWVCGLHCEDNLQIISRTENQGKGNRQTEDH